MNRYKDFRYINLKSIILLSLFCLSLINSFFLNSFLFFLLLYGLSKEEYAIEAFILIQLRSLINPGIGVDLSGTTALIKWVLIFVLSFRILISRNKITAKLKNIYLIIFTFCLYLVVASWIVSSFPVVSVFKIISYIIPFIAILKGIYDVQDINWLNRILFPLGLLLFTSIILLPFPIGYLRNGYAFQGFLNHPNVYGVMLAIFLSGFLSQQDKISLYQISVTLLALFLSFCSGSRTSLISCIFALMFFLCSKKIRKQKNTYFFLIVFVIIILIILLTSDNIFSLINIIVYKGHQNSIFFSRQEQILKNLYKFYQSPFLGTGFNVPYIEGIRNYDFSFDLVVENGNLIMSILGDIGIIGLIYFFIVYFLIYWYGKANNVGIFLITFIVSLGEQSFFSTNNFGIILYMYISIYLIEGIRMKNID